MKKEFLLNLLVLLTIFSGASGESYNKNRNVKNKILNILLQLYNDVDSEDYDYEASGTKKISKNFKNSNLFDQLKLSICR